MNKVSLILAVFLSMSYSVAQAASVSLADINTNDCVRAQSEVNLLNGPYFKVASNCSNYGHYAGSNGRIYHYRLYTTVQAPVLEKGVTIELDQINTDDCRWAQSEVSLLNSSRVRVRSTCSSYRYMGYQGANGRFYNYRLYTNITIY